MATLQKIRNRGTLLMLIVGLALFLFIIGAVLRNSSKYSARSANAVGTINGEPISYEDYRKQVVVNEQNAEAQGRGLTAQQRDAIEVQTWNQIVQGKLLGKEKEALGIKVTADELSHIFLAKTDPTVRNAFGSATEEQIATQIANIEKSGNAQTKAQLNSFKDYVKAKRSDDKYFALLSQGLKVNDAMIQEEVVTEMANFNYIMRAYTSIADSTVSVSDEEIKNYYDAHKELFKQQPSRDIVYVKIDVEPSAEDKAFAEKSIEELKVKFADTEDPMRFAMVNSEVQPNTRYLKKSEIKDADLALFAFSGEKGVYGPYGMGNVLQISRVADTKMLPDSVRASHILIASSAKTEATVDSLMNLLKGGADFASLAKKNSIDKNSAVNGGDLGWFKKGMMVPAFEQVSFQTAKGEVAIAKTQFGTHIVKVTGRGALAENVEIATITKETTPSNKTFQLALTEARHIAENVNTIDELRAVAKEKNLIVNDATFMASSLGLRGVENSKDLVRSAFRAEDENKLLTNNTNSTVFELESSYVIAGLKKINEGEYATVDSDNARKYIEQQLRKEKKAKILTEQLEKEMNGVSTLETLAEKEGVKVQEASNVSFNSSYVSGLGQEPAVVSVALLGNKQISQPIEGGRGVFVIANVEKKVLDLDIKTILEQTKMRYNQMLQQRAQMASQALLESSDLVDERYRF